MSLHAARTLPSIQKLAIFEPPFILNGSPSTAFLARYDREIAEGNVPAALVTAMKGSEMGPAFFRSMPATFFSQILSADEKRMDPQLMADAMVSIIPENTGFFRNVVPKATEELARNVQHELWTARIDG